MPSLNDILAKIKDDPKELRRVVTEIDTNKDFKLDGGELARWMKKHANDLNVQGHNLARDLHDLGPGALKAAKPVNFDDYSYPADVVENGTVTHRKGEINQALMQARDKNDQDLTTLSREMVAITEVIQHALANNQSLVRAVQQKGEPLDETRLLLNKYSPEDVSVPQLKDFRAMMQPKNER